MHTSTYLLSVIPGTNRQGYSTPAYLSHVTLIYLAFTFIILMHWYSTPILIKLIDRDTILIDRDIASILVHPIIDWDSIPSYTVGTTIGLQWWSWITFCMLHIMHQGHHSHVTRSTNRSMQVCCVHTCKHACSKLKVISEDLPDHWACIQADIKFHSMHWMGFQCSYIRSCHLTRLHLLALVLTQRKFNY